MSALERFLTKNSIVKVRDMPIVHTTASYYINSIMRSNTLELSPCTVFKGENLNYFFYGKPSYRIRDDARQSEEWQLPMCFIVDIDAVSSIKRIYPFDSGAFKKGMYPKHISMMNIDEFSVIPDKAEPTKLIGAFFANIKDYFKSKPFDEGNFKAKYGLNVLDAELLALHKLSRESSSRDYDDRRFCVELQTESTVKLDSKHLKAVILPVAYLDIQSVRDHIEKTWNAVPISYDAFSSSSSDCTGQIYEKINSFYADEKII